MAKLLFQELPFGTIQLNNRIVMSPMTRSRAIGNVPNELMARYYAQRATAGLIITEGTAPCPHGLGYARIPGLFNQEQVKGWKQVTDAVHRAGGRIFVQLMHTGRVSHPANMPAGAKVFAPSAIALTTTMFTDSQGMQPFPIPEAMGETDIQNAIKEHVVSSQMAIEAGFDGVELHGANGYLIEQFLNTASNQRTDQWGKDSIESRIRFALETAQQVGTAIGFTRLGMRLSPYGASNEMTTDPQTEELYAQLALKLGQLGLLYLHIADHSAMGAPPVPDSVKEKIRKNFNGHLILAGGYDATRAEADLTAKKGDLIAFGRPFIANPDLVKKLREGTPLHEANRATFYSPGEKGYTDY